MKYDAVVDCFEERWITRWTNIPLSSKYPARPVFDEGADTKLSYKLVLPWFQARDDGALFPSLVTQLGRQIWRGLFAQEKHPRDLNFRQHLSIKLRGTLWWTRRMSITLDLDFCDEVRNWLRSEDSLHLDYSFEIWWEVSKCSRNRDEDQKRLVEWRRRKTRALHKPTHLKMKRSLANALSQLASGGC